MVLDGGILEHYDKDIFWYYFLLELTNYVIINFDPLFPKTYSL